MSFEFEVPFICLLFMILLIVVYFLKKSMNLVENKYFEVMLVCSFIETCINTFLHFLASIYDFSIISTQFYSLINVLNIVISILFFIIFACLFCYTLIISYEKVKEKNRYVRIGLIFSIIIYSIGMAFTKVELYQIGSITTSSGIVVDSAKTVVGLFLLANFIVTFLNIKKLDKRYSVLLAILISLVLLIILSLFFPGILFMDVLLAIMCYVMFFTIENPDLKMIEQLEYAKNVAEKASLAKSDFLSSMSHEIRTPLNAIVGFSEDIMSYKENLPKDVIEDIIDIQDASDNLLEIVGNILDFNKIESGKIDIIETSYSFKEEIEKLIKITTTRIGNKPIQFKMQLDPNLPHVLIGDKGHVKGIINNLLTNAIKYTDKGFVSLGVRCEIKEENCILTIRVEDTGKGMKQEDLSKLFQKFERLDKKNSNIEGTGLGLVITKSLVEQMSGHIEVQSTFGKGSIFTVILPQKIGNLEQKEVISSSVTTKSDLVVSKKILIVDDSEINLKVAKKNVENLGYQAFIVTSGKECLNSIQNNEYNLILMDIMMPEMDGVETLKRLKEIEGFHIPVVALTADAIAGAEEKYKNLGFTSYIAKPFKKDELKDMIEKNSL